MDYSNIMDFIPQTFLILIVALYVLGIFFKKLENVPDKWITVILLLFGITFGVLLELINMQYKIAYIHFQLHKITLSHFLHTLSAS